MVAKRQYVCRHLFKLLTLDLATASEWMTPVKPPPAERITQQSGGPG